MLESLMPFLLGEKSPQILLEMAQQQLDAGNAALENAPELRVMVRALFDKRAIIYTDSPPVDETLALYDFDNIASRLAFAIACLPEELRNAILHEIYKSACVWSGYVHIWEDTTPGDFLRNGADRLVCKDTALGVIAEIEKLLKDTPELLDDYLVVLREKVVSAFTLAQIQLDEMHEIAAECEPEAMLNQLRENEGELFKDDDDFLNQVHPGMDETRVLSSTFKHPVLPLSDSEVVVNDWVGRLTEIPSCRSDYAIRQRFYGLPDDNKIVEVCLRRGDYAGIKLYVHDSELV